LFVLGKVQNLPSFAELTVKCIRNYKYGGLVKVSRLNSRFTPVSCSAYATLKIGAISSSRTSVDSFSRLHGVISQRIVLFKVKKKNVKLSL
jgi:putative component of membrane protein insertase Oxa1/YidC/SpoIIIJ protein YidD